MTIAQAIRQRIPVVLCPRCGWFRENCVSMLNVNCPRCGQTGLDSVDNPTRGPN